MGIQINGQTDTVSSTTSGGKVTITPFNGNVGTGASISSPATNVLTLGTNNIESVRINSTGVGIGTNNPASTLDVGGEITIRRTAAGSEGGQINFARASDNAVAWNIDAYGSTSTPSLRFIDATAATSRMEIDGSGNFGVAVTPWTGISNAFNFKTLVANYQANGTLNGGTWVSTSITLTAASNFVFAKIIAVGHENTRNNGFREYFVSWNSPVGWSVVQLATANQGNDYGLVDIQMSGSTVQVKAANNLSVGQYRLYVTYYLT